MKIILIFTANISEQIGLVYNDIQKNLEKKFEEYHVELIEKVIFYYSFYVNYQGDRT